ncbi:hypothetical protein EDD86DRAFT_270030, partial [Gorgonomyces haynaldii]
MCQKLLVEPKECKYLWELQREQSVLEHIFEERMASVSQLYQQCLELFDVLGMDHISIELEPNDALELEIILKNLQVEKEYRIQQRERFEEQLKLMPLEFQEPTNTDLSLQSLKALESLVLRKQQEYHTKTQQLQTVIAEIKNFWSDLDISLEQQIELDADLRHLPLYLEMAEELRKTWTVKMRSKIDDLSNQLKQLLDKLSMDYSFFELDELYSPLVIPKLEQEIKRLQTILLKSKSILDVHQQRQDLLLKMQNFEKTASDPKRLFRPSFQLLEEEKFRKTCYPTLLKLESQLFQLLDKYQQDMGEHFCLGSHDFKLLLEQEIKSRFVNESVFLFSEKKTPRSKM